MLTDAFVEQSVKTKPGKRYILRLVACVLLALSGIPLMLVVGGLGILVIAFGIYLFTYYYGDKNAEYEYSLTNGSVEIAVIYNLSRRKDLMQFDMSNVSMVVPAGSNRISNKKFTKVYDFSSRMPDSHAISLVVEEDDKKKLVILEPNEKAMEHIKQHAKHKCYDL
ncbi:MAG: DUF6106 family protein [Eubacteriales bacterium]|nr:DUF6106 family protein [Eubacteriales bacterium]